MDVIGTLHGQWQGVRNALLASPRFQSFATAFPPFRPISRRRSRQLFDLLAGFTYSQVLYAVVKLGLIEHLKGPPLGTDALAARLGWPADRIERLLKAAAALDLLERSGKDHWTLGIHGAALAGNPWIAKFIAHHHLLYGDLADPIALLKGESGDTKLKGFWGYSGDPSAGAVDSTTASAYTALMAASQDAVAAEILNAYDFSTHKHLMDVGGSNGTFLATAGTRHPHLRLSLFDLPAVAELGRARLEAAGLSARTTIVPGSFLTDSLPEGADVITLIRIAHDHDDPSVLTLLKTIHRALPPGGTLLLAEPLSGQTPIAPVTDAYFGLYFAAMGQGRTRSAQALTALAREAGFTDARIIRTRMPLVTGMIRLTA